MKNGKMRIKMWLAEVKVPVLTWCMRHDLDIEPFTCPCCGELFFYDEPFMSHDYIGLRTPLHDCGPNYRASSLKLRERPRRFWGSLADLFHIADVIPIDKYRK